MHNMRTIARLRASRGKIVLYGWLERAIYITFGTARPPKAKNN